MSDKPRVVIIGLDPAVVDYAKWPGLTAEKLRAMLELDRERLEDLGFEAQICFVDLGETAVSVLRESLVRTPADCVLIGAGVRTDDTHFLLFEQLINVVHEHAPRARICFNTNPSDTAAAVQRWL